ncbi:MAG: 3-phosphoglycerate dehydrogenase [Clostridiales Family XIII bacterium]|jgi:D-3-phosphoglycerate dehydrogenase|nr:3-phosphoglycerate dehydrogenase [Clostridiales Family XIII bacterium]
MYKVATLNRISPKGLGLFREDYAVGHELHNADIVLVRSQDMHGTELPDNLLAIARAGAGVNNIPVEACSEQGIVVFNTPGANANAVKELTLGALLAAARNLVPAAEWARSLTRNAAEAVEKGKSKFAGEELLGKRLAVIGLGAIGVLVANSAERLGMRVAGYDPYISVQNAHDLSPTVRLHDNLEYMLAHCDYLTIHVPATEATSGMIDYKLLDVMKNRAVFLNFSRDSVVNTEDMRRILEEKKLRLYVTDFPTDELLGLENVLFIPHLGASTKESEENCAVMAVEQLMNYVEHGTIENSVNFPMCAPGVKETATRICVLNRNIPAMLGKLTAVFAERNINIAKLINKSKGDNAYTVIDIGSEITEDEIRRALDFDGIISVRVI